MNGHNNGALGTISFTCLNSPTDKDFVTNEIWDDTGTGGPYGTYWAEVGVADGLLSDGNQYTRNWFWADIKPGDKQVNLHVPSGFAEAAYSTDYPTSILFDGDDSKSWTVVGGNSGVYLGTSYPQPNETTNINAGTEFSDAQDLRDSGSVSSLEYQNYKSVSLDWGSLGAAVAPKGANNDITSDYDSKTSTASWSDC